MRNCARTHTRPYKTELEERRTNFAKRQRRDPANGISLYLLPHLFLSFSLSLSFSRSFLSFLLERSGWFGGVYQSSRRVAARDARTRTKSRRALTNVVVARTSFSSHKRWYPRNIAGPSSFSRIVDPCARGRRRRSAGHAGRARAGGAPIINSSLSASR